MVADKGDIEEMRRDTWKSFIHSLFTPFPICNRARHWIGESTKRNQTASDLPGTAERDSGQVRADQRWLRSCPTRSNDSDAGRSEIAYGHFAAEGGEGSSDSSHAHALQRRPPHQPRRERSSRARSFWLRQRDRCD